MWHEARKIEKRIRGIMIDYRRRAERRTAFYERMREDPHQLLQLHGNKCKLYIDSRLDKPVEESQLVPWQGDPDVLIDRFDARSHLDYLPENINRPPGDSADDEKEYDFNYERYRTLVQIEATGVTEEAYLKQLAIEEWYGKKQAEKHKAEKEALAKKKASIGYKYEGSAVLSEDSDKSDDESDLSDIDISVNIHDLSEEQKTSMDSLATQFGIAEQYYCRQLLKEKKEFDFAKQLEEEEEERSKLSGRRGKRARRTLREKQKATRTTSPPSYAMRGSPTYDPYSPPRHGHTRSSSSRSPSPDNHGKIEYITEFGGASNSQAEKPKIASSRDKSSSSKGHRREGRDGTASHTSKRHRKHSDRSRSRDRSSRGHLSRSRSRSRSRRRHSSRSRSRRRHRSRSSRRSRSRSHHRGRSPSRSRSRSMSRSRSKSRSKSRSRSHEDNYRRRRISSGDKRVQKGSERSRSSSYSRSRSRSRSRSKSPKPSTHSITRKLESQGPKKVPGTTATGEKPKLTPQERLKLRMQKQLSKQIKQDKQVERKKKDDKEKERMDRDNDIYELQRKIRYRPRNDYHHHRERTPSPKASAYGLKDRSRSPSKSPRTRAYEEVGWEV